MNQPNRFRVPGPGESIVFISASVVLIGGFGWLQGWWGGDVIEDPNSFRIGDLASERAERLCVERYIEETGGQGHYSPPVVAPYDFHRSERQVVIHGTIGDIDASALCKIEDGEIAEFTLLNGKLSDEVRP